MTSRRQMLAYTLHRTQFLLADLGDDVVHGDYEQQRLDDTAAALEEVAALLRGETLSPRIVDAERVRE